MIIKEDLLEDIPVELELAVPQELSDHLSAEALPLKQEVCHSDGRVRDKTTRDQEVDASFWVPVINQKTNTESSCSRWVNQCMCDVFVRSRATFCLHYGEQKYAKIYLFKTQCGQMKGRECV